LHRTQTPARQERAIDEQCSLGSSYSDGSGKNNSGKVANMPLIEKELRPVDLIFPERQAAFKEARCMPKPIGCGEKIGKFKDPLSEKEYGISGLCEKCQEEVFGTSEE
jgi:hypothetical protein